MIKKVELLAPVKDRECQQAVIENGADSVYMGYQQFNARMFGKNFNESEFRENIKYAHENNVKVYLTLNTLIREDEMHLALQMATQAVKDHVDGILVQDIGLASEIRKNIYYFTNIITISESSLNLKTINFSFHEMLQSI